MNFHIMSPEMFVAAVSMFLALKMWFKLIGLEEQQRQLNKQCEWIKKQLTSGETQGPFRTAGKLGEAMDRDEERRGPPQDPHDHNGLVTGPDGELMRDFERVLAANTPRPPKPAPTTVPSAGRLRDR